MTRKDGHLGIAAQHGCIEEVAPRSCGRRLRTGDIDTECVSARPVPTATPRAVLCAGLAVPHHAIAHSAPAQFDLWPFEGWVVASLLLTGALYGWRIRRLWRERGCGRGVRPWQALCFGVGLLTLLLALNGPVEALAAVSFSGHMVQHMLLIAVAAPLLALGTPLAPLLRGAPRPLRRAVFIHAAPLTRPFTAFALHGLALWLWHAPGPYEAALAHEGLHLLEHASFLATALLFWHSLIHRRDRAFGHGAGAFWSLATLVHSGMLGALITFASAPLYPTYRHHPSPLGLTALEDQQLAGLIMWVPSGMVYLIAGLLFTGAWLRSVDPA